MSLGDFIQVPERMLLRRAQKPPADFVFIIAAEVDGRRMYLRDIVRSFEFPGTARVICTAHDGLARDFFNVLIADAYLRLWRQLHPEIGLSGILLVPRVRRFQQQISTAIVKHELTGGPHGEVKLKKSVSITRKIISGLFVAAMLLCLPHVALGQSGTLTSNTSNVTLSISLPEVLTVSVNISTYQLDQFGNPVLGQQSLQINEFQNLASSRSTGCGGTCANGAIYVYFSSTNALVNGSNHIPSSAVFYIPDGNMGAQQSCTRSPSGGPAPGSTCAFFALGPVGAANSQSHTVDFSIPTANTFPAGTYTGIINVTAIALP